MVCFLKICFPGGSEGKESAYSAGDLGLIPGLGRSPGEDRGNDLLAWRTPMDGGVWLASPWGGKELDSLKLVLIYGPECIFLGELEKNVYSDVGMNQSIDVHYIQLIVGAVEFSCPYLFSACWILFISERGVEVSIQTSGFICFFWQLSLCYTYFSALLLGANSCLLEELTPLSLCIASF